MAHSSKLTWAALGILAFIAFPAQCLANDDTDRVKFTKEAEAMLSAMISKISGFDKDANAEDTVDAVRQSLALEKKLDELEKVQGDDAAAKKMVVEWSHNLKPFHDAAVNLAHLKTLQVELTEPAQKTCKSEQKGLDDLIASYLHSKAPDGRTAIPNKGKSVGATASAKISKAEGILKMAHVKFREADHFEASGDQWSNLTVAVKHAAGGMRSEIVKMHDEIVKDCTKLAMGEKNPVVIEARKKILDATDSLLSSLQDQVDAWEIKASEFFRLDCAAMLRLNAAYCGELDAGDPDETSEKARVKAETDKIAQGVKGRYDDLKEEMDKIIVFATPMLAKPELKDMTKKILAEMDDERESIKKVIDKGALKGSNSPVIQFYINFGIQAHKALEASSSCDVRDVAFGSDGRPDCIQAKNCMILEFKPDGNVAYRRGKRQVEGYEKAVTEYYQEIVPAYNKYKNNLGGKPSVDAKKGGVAIMQAFDKAGCIKGDDIILKSDVKPYKRCELRYACVK